jgi:tetratricopeptide (TPR) repeat protein
VFKRVRKTVEKHLVKRRHAAAIAACKQAVVDDPKSICLLTTLIGDLYRDAEDFQQAITNYQFALRYDAPYAEGIRRKLDDAIDTYTDRNRMARTVEPVVMAETALPEASDEPVALATEIEAPAELPAPTEAPAEDEEPVVRFVEVEEAPRPEEPPLFFETPLWRSLFAPERVRLLLIAATVMCLISTLLVVQPFKKRYRPPTQVMPIHLTNEPIVLPGDAEYNDATDNLFKRQP